MTADLTFGIGITCLIFGAIYFAFLHEEIWERRWELEKLQKMELLFHSGNWKHTQGNWYRAIDEEQDRHLDTAYERQLKLDEIKRLNLPDTEAVAYLEGSWKDEDVRVA